MSAPHDRLTKSRAASMRLARCVVMPCSFRLQMRLIRHDGALSILRGFKPDELLELAQQAGLNDIWIERHFPSRLVLSAAAALTSQTERLDKHASPWSAAA